MTKPDGTTQALANNATTYAAQENGLYTFTLTADGETIAQDITIEKIDKVKPTATLTAAGGTGGVYHTLSMAAKASDNASGVAKVEYAFTTAATAPGTGWTAATDSDKLADGRYRIQYTAAQTKQTTIYLYVRVTDNAGNTTTVKSDAYIVIKEPSESQKPKITLTAPNTDWTNQDVTLTWKIENAGAGNCTVYADGKTLTGKKANDTDTFKVSQNGVYMVSLTDENGDSASAALAVNNIDKEPPVLEEPNITPTTKWAREKRVEFLKIEDNHTPQYDEKGATGYSGSGKSTGYDYKRNNGSYTHVNVSSVVALSTDTNATYTFRITDKAGNVTEKSVVLDGIDRTKPKLTVTVNATKKASGWYTDSTVPVTLEFTDPANGHEGGVPSGVKSVQYAFVNPTSPTDTPTVPASLTSLGSQAVAKGSATCNLTQNGIWYLYCKVTDNAGNETAGWMNADGELTASASQAAPIKKDSYKGSGTITGQTTSVAATTGLTIFFELYYGPSGGRRTWSGSASASRYEENSGPNTKKSRTEYNSIKTTGTKYIYYKPNSWGTNYYWSFYVRKVTFDSQGGSTVEPHLVWTTQSSASTSTKVDCSLTKPTDPTRTGYTFKGWYTDAACSDGKAFDFENQTQVRVDTTLYAKWEAIPYNVTYHLMMPDYEVHHYEGTGTPNYTSYRTYTETEYQAPDDKTTYFYAQKMELPVPELPSDVTGFTFDGWYTNENYTGTRYTSIPETTASDMEYYARWLDTQAPVRGSATFWYTTGQDYLHNSWYRAIVTVGYKFRENVAIDPDSAEYQIDGGEWKKGSYRRPSHQIGTYWEIDAKEVLEGIHTYRYKVTDTSGNSSEIATDTMRIDKTNPTADPLTYSAEPIELYKYVSENYPNYTYVNETQEGNYQQKALFFSEAPTISIPVHDKPAAGANACSGLWKLSYTETHLSAKGEELSSQTVEVELTGQKGKEDGTAEITLQPYENDNTYYHGKITDIRIYDMAGNSKQIGSTEEIYVNTRDPYFTDWKLVNTSAGINTVVDSDTWYNADSLAGGTRLHMGFERATYKRLQIYRNGELIQTKQNHHVATFTGGDVIENIEKDTGINTYTAVLEDWYGNIITTSITLKISGGKEQTPKAACDYPADAVAQLAPNMAYKIKDTLNNKTYSVSTNERGEIPFVFQGTDLAGKTITIVKNGDGGYTSDSDAQTLKIKERPKTYAVIHSQQPNIEAELLQEAGDAQIKLTIDADSYAWEYKTPDGAWTDVPADGTVKNLPTGKIQLRAKAKAQTQTPDDGYPHGEASEHTISAGAGTITAQFDLNDSNGTTATNKPADQTKLTYKSRLKEPAAPKRQGYDFIGWHHQGSGYQADGSSDTTWHFKDDAATNTKANIVGDILGTDRANYQYTKVENNVYYVTLYADWRENVNPTLTATLKTTTNGTAGNADGKNFYPNLFIDLTYSDNVGITKLFVKKDSGAYTELTGNGIGSGTANTSYSLTYNDIEEGIQPILLRHRTPQAT